MSLVKGIEPCHCDLNHNLNEILKAIQGKQPSHVFGCGEASQERRQAARRFEQALRAWQAKTDPPQECDGEFEAVSRLLGERDERKDALVAHLIGKLANNEYEVYADEDEDFETSESRIQHLDICNFNWNNNLTILLDEIGSSRRSRGWHGPGLFCAHGDKDPNNSYPEMLKATLSSIPQVKDTVLLEELQSKLDKEFPETDKP